MEGEQKKAGSREEREAPRPSVSVRSLLPITDVNGHVGRVGRDSR